MTLFDDNNSDDDQNHHCHHHHHHHHYHIIKISTEVTYSNLDVADSFILIY